MSFLFLQASLVLADQDQKELEDIKKRLALGNPKGKVEIYVVSDWFCKSCRKLEPKLEELYNTLKSKATFYFVDYPINRQSTNFLPYHIAFLIAEKKKYLEARQALFALTDTKQAPTDEDIKELAEKKGLKFKDLSFEDVKSGTEFFDDTVKRYEVAATPTVIVVNKETGESEKFKGSQIKEKKISQAIKDLQ